MLGLLVLRLLRARTGESRKAWGEEPWVTSAGARDLRTAAARGRRYKADNRVLAWLLRRWVAANGRRLAIPGETEKIADFAGNQPSSITQSASRRSWGFRCPAPVESPSTGNSRSRRFKAVRRKFCVEHRFRTGAPRLPDKVAEIAVVHRGRRSTRGWRDFPFAAPERGRHSEGSADFGQPPQPLIAGSAGDLLPTWIEFRVS